MSSEIDLKELLQRKATSSSSKHPVWSDKVLYKSNVKVAHDNNRLSSDRLIGKLKSNARIMFGIIEVYRNH